MKQFLRTIRKAEENSKIREVKIAIADK